MGSFLQNLLYDKFKTDSELVFDKLFGIMSENWLCYRSSDLRLFRSPIASGNFPGRLLFDKLRTSRPDHSFESADFTRFGIKPSQNNSGSFGQNIDLRISRSEPLLTLIRWQQELADSGGQLAATWGDGVGSARRDGVRLEGVAGGVGGKRSCRGGGRWEKVSWVEKNDG